MLTTITLDDDLLRQAQELSGLSERIQLLPQALVERESARRLAALRPASPSCRPSPAGALILVDTSVWVDHLRRGEPLLSAALIGRARLWTRDRRSRQMATDLAVACRWA